MNFDINRYLMSNADGRWDGAEKATRHNNLCNTFLAVWFEVPNRMEKSFLFIEDGLEIHEKVHMDTRELTNNLDTAIGFPLKGRPDYDALAPLFFEKFIELAIKAVVDYKKGE